jgi:hypothetical protein
MPFLADLVARTKVAAHLGDARADLPALTCPR